MLFTAHNELFELSLRRENTKCRTPPPPALYSLRVDIFPQLYDTGTPLDIFAPANFPNRVSLQRVAIEWKEEIVFLLRIILLENC